MRWTISRKVYATGRVAIRGPDGSDVAMASPSHADLIAAAPDLLFACESALPFLQELWKTHGVGGSFEVMDAMRTAIAVAKASGR